LNNAGKKYDIILWNILKLKEGMRVFMGTTVFATVLSGVVVFIAGQIILKIIIEPLSEYKALKSKISYSLVFYANMYSNPMENTKDFKENSDAVKQTNEAGFYLRNLAAEFSGWLQVMPIYKFFSFIRVIPSRKDADKVRGCLIGLSNGLTCSNRSMDSIIIGNYERKQEIYKILKLH